MDKSRQCGKTALRAMGFLALCIVLFPVHQGDGSASAQSFSSQGVELDQVLFVQAPEHDNGNGGIIVAWIPEPILKSCLGKTMTQCSSMDYCIRTTTKSVSMCRNLAIPLSRLPSYPPGMRPRRVMSLSFYKLAPGGPYQPLVDFYKSLPRSSLQQISMDARIKARIRYTHGSDDDDFRLEQVLSVAPF